MLSRKKIELIHFPIERMVADYYTKSLQVSFFRKMRNILTVIIPLPDE